MRCHPAILLVVLLGSSLGAQAGPIRAVDRGTLLSKSDPAASFVPHRSFHYLGGQTIDILHVAGAEQHFFIDAAPDHSIRRFYWIQFEHYYPDNTHTYDYSGIEQRPVRIGPIDFLGDVRVSPDYFTMDNRPGSDSKAAEDFLRAHGLNVDGTFVTLRLFYLTDATRRRELMIIYGEILPGGASRERLTSQITAHAQANISVQ